MFASPITKPIHASLVLSFNWFGSTQNWLARANGTFDSLWTITNAVPSRAYSSRRISLTDIGTDAVITVSSGAGTYSINGGTPTADAGTISAGDILQVFITADSAYSTEETPVVESTVITIAGTDNTFSITNMLEPVLSYDELSVEQLDAMTNAEIDALLI